MSNCLHWDINEPVQKRLEPVDANLEELPARTTESLVAMLLAPGTSESISWQRSLLPWKSVPRKAAQSNLNPVRGFGLASSV